MKVIQAFAGGANPKWTLHDPQDRFRREEGLIKRIAMLCDVHGNLHALAQCFRMSSARTSIWSCSAEMWRLDPCRSKQSKDSRDIPSPSDLFGATQIDSWSRSSMAPESRRNSWTRGRRAGSGEFIVIS